MFVLVCSLVICVVLITIIRSYAPAHKIYASAFTWDLHVVFIRNCYDVALRCSYTHCPDLIANASHARKHVKWPCHGEASNSLAHYKLKYDRIEPEG